jgi:hypothetical protein
VGDYIGATDLTLLLPAQVSIGTNTLPLTLDEVGSIVFQYEAELNAAAAHAGYAVPIQSAASLSYGLMALNTQRGAAAHVLGILFPNAEFTLAKDYRDAYQLFLRQLAAGKLTLPDVDSPGAEGRALPRSFEVTHDVAPSPLVGVGWDP